MCRSSSRRCLLDLILIPVRSSGSQYLDTCNILMRHHFLVHARGIHKFVHVPVNAQDMYCTDQGLHRNRISVYICMCGVVEYRASENVTPACIAEDQYVGAVLVAVAWFLVFFIAAAVISIIYHVS